MDNEWLCRKRSDDEPYPAKSFNSEKINEPDDQFHRDRARITHSASFRRLQSKTQIINLGESDFYRTRLTHSLEVAQLGSSTCNALRAKYKNESEILTWIPENSLIEAIGLGHDLGHPPFGHAGEIALNSFMKDHGGFEGNGQTLRIAAKLGEYSPHHGLDLTRRTLLGLVKYPAIHDTVANYDLDAKWSKNNIESSKPPKCILNDEKEVLDWILQPFSDEDKKCFMSIVVENNNIKIKKHHKTQYKSLDCSIMELADDIAYGVHDLEDALALGLITSTDWEKDLLFFKDKFPTSPLIEEKDTYIKRLFSSSGKDRKHAISKLIGYFVRSISIEKRAFFQHQLLSFNALMEIEAAKCLKALKNLVVKYVIKRNQVQLLEFKGQNIVLNLFEVFSENPNKLLPKNKLEEYTLANDEHKKRVICDYIAGMTDIYATKQYCRLFMPNMGSIFDHI